METPEEILVGAGFSESIKVRINPDSEARSDQLHMATVWVSTGTGLNLSANIIANITESQSVAVEIPDNVDSDETKSGVQVSVIPGTPVTDSLHGNK